jgi:ribose 5-phosphate isomerase B
MKIFIGADHNGFQLRNMIVQYLRKAGYDVQDDGDVQLDPNDDFPIFAQKVVADMLSSDDKDPRGILICGSGQGMCMAANRFKGIRAALGYDKEAARSSRNDDDSNVLCLPARLIQQDKTAVNVLIETWLNTPFAGAPRFVRRIQEMDNI